MEDDDLLRELNRKVDNLQRDINDIQGDVNILSTLNKERHREDLINLIEGKFGRSTNKRLCWYYADGTTDTEDLAELVGTSQSTIRNNVSDLTQSGLLNKRSRNGTVHYGKAEITTDIGLESDLEEKLEEL